MFKLFVCPNEAACEGRDLSVPVDGEVMTRMVDKWTYSFVENDVCSYRITPPWNMNDDDKLFVKIDKILNSQVYIAKGKRYRWMSHLEKRVVYDKDIFELWGPKLEFYIVGVSTSIFKGQFRVKAWIEKNVAEVDQVVYETPNVIV